MREQRLGFRVLSALVCDDVRREGNGKEIIIGVYPGRILVSKMPATLSLLVWLYLEASAESEFFIEVAGFDPNERQFIEGKMSVKTSAQHGTSSATLPPFPLFIERDGFFTVKIKINKKKWQTIVRKRIEMGPSAKLADA